jgi:hypothetical protein
MKKLLLLITLFLSTFTFGQLVINELDVDNPGTDNKEFIELKSATPNFSLNGYILVFFNGTGTAAGNGKSSYKVIDLNGYSTDLNGIISIGNVSVTPAPTVTFANTSLQNGPDGVGLYQAAASSFPTNTQAIATGLIDSLCYGLTASTPTAALNTAFGTTVCVIDNQSSYTTSKSIQRSATGTYTVAVPNPGVPNDGSGVGLNYLTTTTNLTTDLVTNLPTVTEGQSIIFTFTTTTAVTTSPLVINFTLANGSFTTSDYSGTLTATIPVGSTSVTKVVPIINDGINDGDEEAQFTMSAVASGYTINNNNITIRVNNINFVVLPFGTPANPTFGQVANTKPVNYYASIEGLSGAALKLGLQNIIANPAVIHGQNYGDVYDILKVADQNPANSNQVWLIYTEEGRSKLDEEGTTGSFGKYNREHIYCQSRGGFSGATSSTPNGINNWDPAGPDIIATGHADAHHIRAVDAGENSSRNDRNYGVDYNGPTGSTSNAWKGDVARALFYMGVRYNGLNVENGNPSGTPDGHIGDLATLLTWNTLDPADDFEMNRNNYIYTWQINRNPFIDYPDLATYIYGVNYGQPWHAPVLGTTTVEELKVGVFPNPARDFVSTYGIMEDTAIEIYDMTGAKVFTTITNQDIRIPLQFASGIYMMKLSSDNKMVTKKIVVN